ncbi:hypothetical protein D3C73_646510 [compost metagenome]
MQFHPFEVVGCSQLYVAGVELARHAGVWIQALVRQRGGDRPGAVAQAGRPHAVVVGGGEFVAVLDLEAIAQPRLPSVPDRRAVDKRIVDPAAMAKVAIVVARRDGGGRTVPRGAEGRCDAAPAIAQHLLAPSAQFTKVADQPKIGPAPEQPALALLAVLRVKAAFQAEHHAVAAAQIFDTAQAPAGARHRAVAHPHLRTRRLVRVVVPPLKAQPHVDDAIQRDAGSGGGGVDGAAGQGGQGDGQRTALDACCFHEYPM